MAANAALRGAGRRAPHTLECALAPSVIRTLRHLLAFAAFTMLASPAPAQDKPLGQVCGQLFGARQTALRLQKEGWSLQRIVSETLERPEWRTASMSERKLVLDVLQEAYAEPGKPSSDVIRDCVQRAQAPKQQ
jgi:hypothetical protein